MRKMTETSNSDFKAFIVENKYYVDKTLLIEELLGDKPQVLLFPRPRRFGKTLNLSMLKYYFDIEEDNKELFKGLNIEKSNLYEKHLNKYPTIYLTLKEVKGSSWDNIYGDFKFAISRLYKEHKYLLNSEKLDVYDKKLIDEIIKEEASIQEYKNSLNLLAEYLYKHYEKKVVILLDEYDTSMNAFYDKDTYDNIAGFLRTFIGSSFKDNRYLFKGVITGILKIARESIFSGANNITVYNMLDRDFSDKFGFTEIEVTKILEYYGIKDNLGEIRSWYNGYTFGNSIIYNPFSINNFIIKRELKSYWVNTSDNLLIKDLIMSSDVSIKRKLEELIEGNIIEEEIEENIVFSQLNNPKYLWSLLLFSGYLKASKSIDNKFLLSIPNREIKSLYNNIIKEYFSNIIPNLSSIMDKISLSIMNNDIEKFGEEIRNLLITKLSSHDVGKNKEAVYHVIIFLSLLRLEYNSYEVRSNKESGDGRYDIVVIPKNNSKIGYVTEIKLAKIRENLEKKAQKAISQIEEKKYESELKERGIKNIIAIVVAFKGKKVYVIHKNL